MGSIVTLKKALLRLIDIQMYKNTFNVQAALRNLKDEIQKEESPEEESCATVYATYLREGETTKLVPKKGQKVQVIGKHYSSTFFRDEIKEILIGTDLPPLSDS